MNLSRNSGPFLLANILQIGGKVPELLPGPFKRFLGLTFPNFAKLQSRRHVIENPGQMADLVIAANGCDTRCKITLGEHPTGPYDHIDTFNHQRIAGPPDDKYRQCYDKAKQK